jgi:pimeloyl-ACP methyl ester carboxylesterase
MKWAWAPAAVLIALAGAGCHPLTLDPFFYDPLPAPAGGYQLSTAVIPAAAVETLTVPTPDGETLNGAFIHSSGRRADITVLYFHGQTNNLGTTWPRLEYLYPLGYNIAMVDPRGYGLSTGTPSEAGLQIDERAILTALLMRSDVVATGIVIYGRSLGSGLAIDLASTNPPAVLITESAFASIASFVGDATYVDLPASFVSSSSWNNLAKVPGIPSAYLLFHGTADDYIDPKYSQELAAAHELAAANALAAADAPFGPTLLIMVPGANHDDVPETRGLDTYRADIQSFVENALPAP